MSNCDIYLDEEVYNSDLGDTQIILITGSYTFEGQVYFEGVVRAFDFHSPYIYVRDAYFERNKYGRFSWGGADYYTTISDLEKSHKVDLSWYENED